MTDPDPDPTDPARVDPDSGGPAPVGDPAHRTPVPAVKAARRWVTAGASALGLAAVIAALGVPVGLLWQAVAPRVELVKIGDGLYPVQPHPEGFIADEGWFVAIGALVGLLVAIVTWLVLRRSRGPLLLAALVVGSVAGGVVAAWVGHRIGLAEYERLIAQAPDNTRLRRPVDLRIAEVRLWLGFVPRVRGVVLVQALIAAATYTALALTHPAPSLRNDDPVLWEEGPQDGTPPLSSGPLSSDLSAPPAPVGAPAPPVPERGSPPPGAGGSAPPVTG